LIGIFLWHNNRLLKKFNFASAFYYLIFLKNPHYDTLSMMTKALPQLYILLLDFFLTLKRSVLCNDEILFRRFFS